MKSRLKVFQLFLLFLIAQTIFVISTTSAQLYDCGGIIKNTQCQGGKLLMEESPYTAPPPEAKEKHEKELLIQRLESLTHRAKQRWQVDYLIEPITVQCQNVTVSECAQLVDQAQRDINSIISSKENSASKNMANAKSPAPPPSVTISPNANNQDTQSTSIVTILPPPIIINGPNEKNYSNKTRYGHQDNQILVQPRNGDLGSNSNGAVYYPPEQEHVSPTVETNSPTPHESQRQKTSGAVVLQPYDSGAHKSKRDRNF
jgi:hypothetical protein